MSLISMLLVGFLATASDKGMNEWADQAAKRCGQGPSEVLYANDVGWGLSFIDAAALYNRLYTSNKRLDHRFYFSEETQAFKAKNPITPRDLNIPIQFAYSIKKHIEEALRLQYAEWAFFPDMGHNHFFLPQEQYDSWTSLPREEMMEAMIASGDIKMLYHTLEQIQVKDKETGKLDEDPWAQWRYYTRNIVGDNMGQGQLEIHKKLTGNYNTVNDPPPGYKYWGAGVNLSSNKDGCFSFEHNGQVSFFDLSFYDLAYQPEGEGGYKESN